MSRVTNMDNLFSYKQSCNPPIGNWNTTAVNSMESTFEWTPGRSTSFILFRKTRRVVRLSRGRLA